MVIAIHDCERKFSHSKVKFPNLALMKISAFHKARGDIVEWWTAEKSYDKVYSSKIFTFTPDEPLLPENAIKGGTGYGIYEDLPPIIDKIFPDYSIYPDCDFAIGYLTRGCIRACPWCVVPLKEGGIKPYLDYKNIVRADTKKLVLMDNNILAHDFGVWQLEKFIETPYRIDVNQGLDCRLVTGEIAEILSKIKWISDIRFACDNFSTVEYFVQAVKLLEMCGVTQTKIRAYFLVKDIDDAVARVQKIRKYIPRVRLYGQAYRDFSDGGKPCSKEALDFAQRYIYPQIWQKRDWYDTPEGRKYLKRS